MYQNLANVLQTYSQFVYYIKADPMLRNGFYMAAGRIFIWACVCRGSSGEAGNAKYTVDSINYANG